MSTFDTANWLHEIFNLESFEHSNEESIDIAIKKEHDCIIYLYKLSKLGSISESEKKEYINQMVALISSHCITEEIIVYPILFPTFGKQNTVKMLQEHRKFCNDIYALCMVYNMNGPCNEFVNGLDELMEDFQNHLKEEENSQLPICLKRLNKEENRTLSRSYLEFKKVNIKKINPLAPDNPILGD